MHLYLRNVNDAFREVVGKFHRLANNKLGYEWPLVKTTSRVGDVLQIVEPVTLTYSNPRERVLFNEARDANPFFHCLEALHMLAGRNDIETLAYYSANYRECVQDGDSKVANGAYGYRWRNSKPLHTGATPLQKKVEEPDEHAGNRTDQLAILINHLKRIPTSRRAVLQMWNVEDDLLKVDVTKDVCCNLSVMFSLRWETPSPTSDPNEYLDMTVTNRSNDMVWGALGANYVHFSFLQEYMAAHLGAEVGVYNQFTNNLHVYTARWKPEEYLKGTTPDYYQHTGTKVLPLVKDPRAFDEQLPRFFEAWCGKDLGNKITDGEYTDVTEPFLEHVAFPMAVAFFMHKQRKYRAAQSWASEIMSDDWRIACVSWLQRREAGYNARRNLTNPYSKNELARIEGNE